MANLETPPTPLYNSNMFNALSEMARIIKDNDEALNAEIGGGGGGATDADVAAFVADPNSDTRGELDSLYAGQGGGTVEVASVTFSSGYSNYAGTYTPPRVVKVNGRHCTLEAGLVTCPSSLAAQTYYTIATIPAAFRPNDSVMRMGVAHVYHGSPDGDKLTPGQFRVNASGQLQFLIPSALGGTALYIIPQGLTWVRV